MTITRRDACRICGSTGFTTVIELGPVPLANAYREEDDLTEPEPHYPLTVYRCTDCGLVQLRDIVDPAHLFSHYAYVSGETSESLPDHFTRYADRVLAARDLDDPFIVGIGSNDGTLLKAFQQEGAQVLGVDPAENIAAIARDRGVPTRATFFDPDVATSIRAEEGAADIVVANNVLGHVDDLHGVIDGISTLLADDGELIFEVPYLGPLLDDGIFDTIYHEHRSYFSFRPLRQLFDAHGMSMTAAERLDVQGGSIRVTVTNRPDRTSPDIRELLDREDDRDLHAPETDASFRRKASSVRDLLTAYLEERRTAGKTIAAYGAPAKASVLLSYCRLGAETIDYATDEIPQKQGAYIPGTRIPIEPTATFRADDGVDDMLLLAWNYVDEIVDKESWFLEDGGRFIVPLPEPHIVTADGTRPLEEVSP